MSSGEPTETIRPPTWSESTQRLHPGEGLVVVGRVGAGDPGHHQLGDPVAQRQAARAASSTVGSGRRPPDGIGAGAASEARPTAGRRRRAGPSRARGAWRAQISRPAAGCCCGPLGCAAPGRRRRRGPSAPDAVRPGIEVLLTRQPAPGPRPAGRSGDQPGGRGCAAGSATWSDCGRPASGWWRCSAPSTASAARPIPAPPSRHRWIRPPAFQSTVFTAGLPPPPTRCSPGIDVMLVDLQDAGARYYTYLSTTIEVMQAAARHGHPGRACSTAPTRSAGRCRATCSSTRISPPVGRLAVPMRHGHDAGRAGPARPGRPRARGATSGWCRSPGGAATRRSTQTGLPVRPAQPEPPDAREPLPLSGHSASSRAPTCRWAGGRMRRSSRSARPGSTPRRCSRRCAAAALPGRAFARGVSFTPRAPGDGKYADTAAGRDPARGHRPRARTTRPPPRSTFSPRSGAGIPTEFGWIPAHFDRLAGTTEAAGGDRGRRRTRRRSSGAGKAERRDVPRASAAGAALPGVNSSSRAKRGILPVREIPRFARR